MEDYYNDAKLLISDYTGLTEEEIDEKPLLEIYCRKVAASLENREGTEGETSRSEGDISRTFEEGLIPAGIRRALSHYVKNKVVRL